MVCGDLRKRYPGLRIVTGCLLSAVMISMLPAAGMAGELKTVAEIALYQGPDREKMLIEGARKEGQLIMYHSHVRNKVVVSGFQKKYPFLKVSEWRSSGEVLFRRLLEEYAGERFLADVVETTDLMGVLNQKGILQEYYTPAAGDYGNEYMERGGKGIYFLADRESYIGLGFNTKKVSEEEAPRNLQDLLDPKWKGMMSITSSKTSVTWLGNALEVMGRDFIEKLSGQNIKVQNMSGGALLNLIASGEVPLSPTIFNDTVIVIQRKGAPAVWRPLEPLVTNIGSSGLVVRSPHPHASMLFLDYIHSREGQEIIMKGGLGSPRKDMGSPESRFKKTIFTSKYSPVEFEKKYNQWENLLRTLFLRKK